MNYKKDALKLHKGGKLEIISKIKINEKNLKLAYTPGVAGVCNEIFKNPKRVYDYTIKKNSVAIVTDGSKVLGFGNLGAYASIPVMEGKAILFKTLAGIDAFPICLKTQNTEEIVTIIKNISPVFGAINIEDISAPRCFEIEEKLQDIGIPVMHDDQHCTAIAVLAGLINSCKVIDKKFDDLNIVVNGAGAAGTAIARLLVCADIHERICKKVGNVIVCDSEGIIYGGRVGLSEYKEKLAKITNKSRIKGTLEDAIKDADVFIGVSVGNVLKERMIKKMNRAPIIFALANPVPEIMPDKAKKAGASIIATGRSDFPNQVNNVLVFPGVFRGLLDSRTRKINEKMKLNAAYALANVIKKPEENKILPNAFDNNVVKSIANVVKEAH